MTVQEVMQQLEALGREQTRKTYRRHGAGEVLFGVSYADMGKLKKKIKTDHALARGLWATGNHDAQILATMIADPKHMDAKELDSWAGDLTNYTLTAAFAGVVAQSDLAAKKMQQWTRSPEEWLGYAGWTVLAHMAQDGSLKDAELEPYLDVIQKEIHSAKNRVRHGMNGALIAIGGRGGKLEQVALEVARKIGKVVVDHGDTDCKTPDAASYIRKLRERQAARA